MDHTTSLITGNKTHYHIVEWVRRCVTALVQRLSWRLAALGARLYAVDDRTAIQHGWTITRRRGELARTYRDPGFGTVHSCARCGGWGAADGAWCAPCAGTGRVTSGAPQFEGQSP